ncbi:MAG: hypothetical protein ACKVP4_11960 [Hyphomicrobium sp.]
MSRRILKLIAIAIAIHLVVAAPTGGTAIASVQDDLVCWDPDIEFPTTCDDDDD